MVDDVSGNEKLIPNVMASESSTEPSLIHLSNRHIEYPLCARLCVGAEDYEDEGILILIIVDAL